MPIHCENVCKPNQSAIILTLTREQAELLIETFDAIFDYDYFLILDELKKQIEEKLK